MKRSFERSRVALDRLPPVVRFKWTEPLLDEGFTPFPKRLIRSAHRIFHGSLGIEHLAVLLALVDYRRPNLTRNPSLEYLAFCAGLSAASAWQCLQDMNDSKLLALGGNPDELDVDLQPLFDRVMRESEHEG